MRFYWNLVLGRLGIKCDLAENADKALKLVFQKPYQLILMDIQMPIMSGLDATMAIRNHEKETGMQPTTIVGVTNGLVRESISKEAGMDHHFQKPLSIEEAREIIELVAPTLLPPKH